MRDEERYPIPAEVPSQGTHWETLGPESSLPQVTVIDTWDSRPLGYGHGLYVSDAQHSFEPEGHSPPKKDAESSAPVLEKPPRRRTIFGLRRRVFWMLAGAVSALVIVGAVVGAVVGSSRIGSGGGNAGGSSTSSSSPMAAANRHIGAAAMNVTGSTGTNVQVVYQDLNTSDLLYRLVWNDQASGEQRLSLSPAPQRKTPIAVTTTNTTASDGIMTNVFYLSEDTNDSSMSTICQVTLQCSLNAENCTVSDATVISANATNGVVNTSGLAATLVSDNVQARVFYKAGSHGVRVLSGTSGEADGWQDTVLGSASYAGSDISVNLDPDEDTLQVIFVNKNTKEFETFLYSDAAGPGNTPAVAIVSSDPPGWSTDDMFSSCFVPELNQHHLYYVSSTGGLYGMWANGSSANWTQTHVADWGTVQGGIASVGWGTQVRLLHVAGDPATLSRVRAADSMKAIRTGTKPPLATY
ncbi:hypothetical protein M406DRAFT_330214 [Cryphonectria parasitica EP155]|uniref:Fucose-specific lectin n=1 Tax=Cryphonectria parasitica (strain ATCC 38755 / EP155) TaxID=660469 RepID=A0A9P4Y3Q8_CRYP1|nr:uncharacterized protein M406DRAFT_330214 [Cryphonectria parasitica EP155]KAF3766387.1 hypothetical protein M406DRAFT_330214 [Cryphonectria parasitica EP155]